MKHYLYLVFSIVFSSSLSTLATSYPGSFIAEYSYHKSTGETLVVELGSNGSNEVYVTKSLNTASTPDFLSLVRIDGETFRQEVVANNIVSIFDVNMNTVKSKKIDLSFFSVIASKYQQACGEENHLVPELIINFNNNKLGVVLGGSYKRDSTPWLSWLQDDLPDSLVVNSSGLLDSILDGSNTVFKIQNTSTSYQSPSFESFSSISTTNLVEESKSELAAHTIQGKNIIQYFDSKNSETVLSWLNNNYDLIATRLHEAGMSFYNTNKTSPEMIELKNSISSNMPQTIETLRGTILADMKESVDIDSLYPSTNNLLTNIYDLFIDEFNEGIVSSVLLELENEN